MLKHIAITINDDEEIKNFYKDVLLFSLKRKFVITPELSLEIFNMYTLVDVFLMEQNNIQFEIFVSREKEKKIFSHVCLALWKSYLAYEKAVNSGYKTKIKINPGYDTYFIWDKSGNLFEIKEIT